MGNSNCGEHHQSSLKMYRVLNCEVSAYSSTWKLSPVPECPERGKENHTRHQWEGPLILPQVFLTASILGENNILERN